MVMPPPRRAGVTTVGACGLECAALVECWNAGHPCMLLAGNIQRLG